MLCNRPPTTTPSKLLLLESYWGIVTFPEMSIAIEHSCWRDLIYVLFVYLELLTGITLRWTGSITLNKQKQKKQTMKYLFQESSFNKILITHFFTQRLCICLHTPLFFSLKRNVMEVKWNSIHTCYYQTAVIWCYFDKCHGMSLHYIEQKYITITQIIMTNSPQNRHLHRK